MIKVTIPTSLNEITLRQYKHFLKIAENLEDTTFLNAKMVEIFCSMKLADVMKLKLVDVQEITEVISNMFDEKPKLVKRFDLKGVDYGFITDLDELSLGEYIDLDNHIGDWSTIEKAMNVLYRPVIAKLKDKYTIEEYRVGQDEFLLDMPLDAAMSSVFFLWNLGMELSQTMMNSLETGEGEVLTKFLNSQKSGGGIKAFTASLTEILQDLKVSLN